MFEKRDLCDGYCEDSGLRLIRTPDGRTWHESHCRRTQDRGVTVTNNVPVHQK